MGISHSTARWAAPTSFLLDFAAQQYGMLSTPNMKAIHDANLSFWSPQPYFIAAFFFPQQVFQLAWLYRLYKIDPKKSEKDRKETDIMLDYVPYYCIGNLCIGTWMIFWNSEHLKIANVFVLINSLSQLYYIGFRQPAMNLSSRSSTLTHIISKTFAGIGVLDLVHNGSVAYFNHQTTPSLAIKVVTGLFFGGLALNSDWLFGGCLVYDLVALSVGQRGIGENGWGGLLGLYALGTAGIVGARNFWKQPYVRDSGRDYQAIDGAEEE